MEDYEGMILEKQDDIYDGITKQDDIIEVRCLNLNTRCYEITKKLTGDAALAYMEAHGIW